MLPVEKIGFRRVRFLGRTVNLEASITSKVVMLVGPAYFGLPGPEVDVRYELVYQLWKMYYGELCDPVLRLEQIAKALPHVLSPYGIPSPEVNELLEIIAELRKLLTPGAPTQEIRESTSIFNRVP